MITARFALASCFFLREFFRLPFREFRLFCGVLFLVLFLREPLRSAVGFRFPFERFDEPEFVRRDGLSSVLRFRLFPPPQRFRKSSAIR